ncbi:MAG: hypothetical protein V4490_04065 [Pseudomonadota bacterium]
MKGNLRCVLATVLCGMVFSLQAAPVFPISTEMEIGKLQPMLMRAPKGVYVTTGGERAFRGAAMFQGAEHVVIVDNAPEIIRFAKINTILLKAKNKEEYKDLRWMSSFETWSKLSAQLTKEDFEWWSNNIRTIKNYSLPEELNRYGVMIYQRKFLEIREKLRIVFSNPLREKFNNNEQVYLANVSWSDVAEHAKINDTLALTEEELSWLTRERERRDSCARLLIGESNQAVDLGQVLDYRTGNYLFDDVLYARLHQLALAGKIVVSQLDFTKESDVEKLVQNIKNTKKSLAVLDLNNLFQYDYIGEARFHKVVDTLLPLGGADSLLILMSNYKEYACAQFQVYLGFTFENARSWPKGIFLDSFISNLPQPAYPLIDGRVYEGQDKLPLYLRQMK